MASRAGTILYWRAGGTSSAGTDAGHGRTVTTAVRGTRRTSHGAQRP